MIFVYKKVFITFIKFDGNFKNKKIKNLNSYKVLNLKLNDIFRLFPDLSFIEFEGR